MLLIDPTAAIAAIPSMLASEPRSHTQAFDLIKLVVGASGALPPEGEARLRQIESMFSGTGESPLAPATQTKPTPPKPTRPSLVKNEGRR